MPSLDPRPPRDEATAGYARSQTQPSDRRRRWLFIGAGVAVFAGVLAVIYFTTAPPAPSGFGGSRGGPPGAGRAGSRGGRSGGGGPPMSVNAAVATAGDMPIYLTELGTATPTATITVIPQISGVLQTVAFTEGQMVKKGQFLAQIDPRPYQAALMQAEGALAKDQASLAQAKRDLARYKTLLAQNSIASQQVDQAQALVQQGEGQVKADEGAVATQKLNLAYCHITAPADGRVGLRQVDPGNFVAAGTSTGIVVITVLNPMDVLFTIPEDNLDAVARRVREGARLEAVALDRSRSKPLAVGTLLTLDNQVDTTTGTIRAKARFQNTDGALFPNQFVNLRLTVDTLKNVPLVPTSAILKGPDGMFVYVAQKEMFLASAHVTPVKVGPASGETTAVLSGLAPGQVVITDGSDRLKDGARVLLPGDCVPAALMASAASGSGPPGAGPAGSGKGGGGVFGLFAKKAGPSPMAAIACKPGERRRSLLNGTGVITTAPAAPAPSAADAAASAEASPMAAAAGRAIGATRPSGAPAASAPHAPTPQGAPAATQPASAPAAAPAPGARSGRMQAMISNLGLDAQQAAKAEAIFAEARSQGEDTGDMRSAMQGAFAKLSAMLRPDQKAKLEQLRAQRAAEQGRDGGGAPREQ